MFETNVLVIYLCFKIFSHDHHCKTQSELIETIKDSQKWMLFRECVQPFVILISMEYQQLQCSQNTLQEEHPLRTVLEHFIQLWMGLQWQPMRKCICKYK